MRGGAQSHLMRCDDGHYYVVKFQNNPQGGRILANEMLAGRLALALGLPVTEPEVVEVSDWLVEHSPDMYLQIGNDRIRCASGLQFGSRFPCDPLRTPVYDFLPDTLLEDVQNRDRFAGILVFDKWTCNCDSRQLVFHRTGTESSQYAATMIDQGYCFHAAEWDFPDAPLRGLYGRPGVYTEIAGLESFEPFLKRLENLDVLTEQLCSRVDAIPGHISAGPGVALYEPHLHGIATGQHDDRNLSAARMAATAFPVARVTITSTFWAASSRANLSAFSGASPVNRGSSVKSGPSTQPSSRRPSTNGVM